MRFSVFLLLAAAPLLAQQILSPEVLTDRTVTFRVQAANALKVELALEGVPRQAMTKDEKGVWSLTTGPLDPDIYGYTFVIDGNGFVDPSNGQIKPNAFSTNSAVLVSGEKPMPWEQTRIPHGVVHHHFYESAIAGDKRDFYVYTPPNWEPKKRYPLLVLQHGFSDYADGWTAVGKANLIFDALIAEGKAKPMIVVMSLGYGVPIDVLRTGLPRDPGIWKNNVDKFGEALLKEVLPAAEAAYKIEKKPERRAIAGLSMGGAEALQVGLNHLEQFAWIGAFSAGGANANFAEAFPQLSAKDNDRLKLLWMACGKDDRLIADNRKFVEWLNSKQIRNTWIETSGAHTWLVWRRYLSDFTQQLKW